MNVKQAKIRDKLQLYSILLKIPKNELSDVEVNIMYELSQDPDIQEILDL